MNKCPICHSLAFETADIVLFSDATSPAEYSEPYLVCSKCLWTDRPPINITEEIPF